MQSATCNELLRRHQDAGRHLCIGLDPDLARLPAAIDSDLGSAERIVEFNRQIIAATTDLAAAYKPNTAFYEALGESGFFALARTIEAIREMAPEVPVILDAKRGDIGSTNLGYMTAAFDVLGANALTVHPYLGREALGPLLDRTDRTLFVLARTSNPGAGEFQDLEVDGRPLYQHVAFAVASHWNINNNCGLVIGATYPDELLQIRRMIDPAVQVLIPGVGAQGGDLSAVVLAHNDAASSAFLVSVSRSVLYASSGEDFGAAARDEAERLHRAVLAYRVRPSSR